MDEPPAPGETDQNDISEESNDLKFSSKSNESELGHSHDSANKQHGGGAFSPQGPPYRFGQGLMGSRPPGMNMMGGDGQMPHMGRQRFRGRGGFRPGFRGHFNHRGPGPRFGPRGAPHFDNWGNPMPYPGMGPMRPGPGMPPMGPMGPMGPGPWNPGPGPMAPPGPANQNQQQNNNQANPVDLSGEIWIQTKASEGKFYYYNARTRETTWTKPEGDNVKILTQEQVDQMTKSVNSASQNMSEKSQHNALGDNIGNDKKDSQNIDGPQNNKWNQNQNQWGGQPNMPGPGGPPQFGMGPGNMPPMNNFGGPPPFGMSPNGPPGPRGKNDASGIEGQGPLKLFDIDDRPEPLKRANGIEGREPGKPFDIGNEKRPPLLRHFGSGNKRRMPLKHFAFGAGPGPNGPNWNNFGMPSGPGAPGPPGPMVPNWGMPPPGMNMPPNLANQNSQMPPMNQNPAPIAPKPEPVVQQPPAEPAPKLQAGGLLLDGKINPDISSKAAPWSEHKAPDNRSYFYNEQTKESVWIKPQALADLEAAKTALENLEKEQKNDAADSDSDSEKMTNGNEKDDSKSTDSDNDQEMQLEDDAPAEKAEEPQKTQQDLSRPVSSQPVSGTPWCIVWTGDQRVFFYNPTTKTSVWEKPPDILGRPDVDKILANPPTETSDEQKKEPVPKKEPVKAKEEPAAKKMKMEFAPVAEQLKQASKPPAQPEATYTVKIKDEVKQINVGMESAIEAEMKAARERAQVPLEIRMTQFKDLLTEKGVSAFSAWEKELSKIVFDPRYLLLTSKERRHVFDKYVKERAEEERREKRNKLKERKEEFRKLMEEAALSGKSSFTDFAAKYSKDDRFKNVDKSRERESLFDEYVIEVRRKEKEEKIAKREQARKDFMSLLKETSAIDHHSRWSEIKRKIDTDSRYKSVDSSSLREDWFRDHVAKLREERRRSRDRSRDRDRGRDRDRRRRDSRDRSRDYDREKDRERTKEKKKKDKKRDDKSPEKRREEAENDEKPNENHQSDKEESREENEEGKDGEEEKKRRVEESLRKREEEVQKALAGHLRDRDKERTQHKHDEAVLNFNALLADLVRSTDYTWKEAKKSLKKDSRWESASSLEREEREALFDTHIASLTKKKHEKFRELLDEVAGLDSSWKEVKREIQDDPRYTKFSSSDKKCEREFKEYLKDRLYSSKNEFRELLLETKTLTHKSLKQCTEGDSHMREVLEILQKDRRYLVLDSIPEERSKILMSYLEELEMKGPPPPPTASEPNRRK